MTKNNIIPFVFVFGSNLAGRHGKGAALYARQNYGAVYGQGEGRQGSSYAIPTKDEQLNTLSLDIIENYIEKFLLHVRENPNEYFLLTPIGTGLAGYKIEDIANIFKQWQLRPNLLFTSSWFNKE